jgi:hypothetical protein
MAMYYRNEVENAVQTHQFQATLFQVLPEKARKLHVTWHTTKLMYFVVICGYLAGLQGGQRQGVRSERR